EVLTAKGTQLRNALIADDDADHNSHQAYDRQCMNSGFRDMARNRTQPQGTRVNQSMADEIRRLADKRDDVERVMPGFVCAFAQLGDELTPSGDRFQFGQRLELKAADKIEQRLMLGPDAGQFHALVTKAEQKQRTWRIKVT